MIAASNAEVSLDCIDQLIVLDRGILKPSASSGKWEAGSDATVFLEFYLHIVNFITREARRRPPVDWQVYASGGRMVKISERFLSQALAGAARD
jgi:hypothetical protein